MPGTNISLRDISDVNIQLPLTDESVLTYDADTGKFMARATINALGQYTNTAIVDANGKGDYTTLAAALAAITDDSADKQYVIYVFGEDIWLSDQNARPYITFIGARVGGETAANYRQHIQDKINVEDTMQSSYFIEADLRGIWFNTNLSDLDFSGSNMQRARIRANFSAITLTGTDLSYSDWSEALNIDASTLNDTTFDYANLAGKNLSAMSVAATCSFRYADLSTADLNYINWQESDFTGANLAGTNLGAADMSGCNFTNANLTGTNLVTTGCQNAIFTGANLSGALCASANFTGATLPANASTKALFKALVGSYDPIYTLWTDGDPIGE